MIKNLRVTVNGQEFHVTVEVLPDGPSSPGVGQSPDAPAPIAAPPPPATVPIAAPPSAAPVGSGAPGDVTSPLAGRVESIQAKVNQKVSVGDVLLTLEAMKMNTCVNAPEAGVVEQILVEPGASVREGQLLVRLKAG